MQYKKHLQSIGSNLHYHIPYPPKESDPPRIVFRNNLIWNTCQFTGRLNLIPLQYLYDVIWQNRLLLNNKYSIEKYFKKPFVFDFDDAIWLTEGKMDVDLAISKATMIFAGNEYLAEYSSHFNKNIKIVPTTIDTNTYRPLQFQSDTFTIGWIGTKSNLKYLQIIKQPLLDFLIRTKKSKFIVISNEAPLDFKFDDERIIFKKWIAEKENEWINEFDVGLMPLEDDEWTKGKCSFKMLQYMACGKPVIVSPIGTNKSLLSMSDVGFGVSHPKEWLKAMLDLSSDKSLYKSLSENGRTLVEGKFSCQKWAETVNIYLKELINNSN
jgi:glycosyltransferase involved in cell wall biosynthesis